MRVQCKALEKRKSLSKKSFHLFWEKQLLLSVTAGGEQRTPSGEAGSVPMWHTHATLVSAENSTANYDLKLPAYGSDFLLREVTVTVQKQCV